MPRPIQVLTVREFEKLLEEWTPGRKVTEVHVHCTDQPRHGNFRGLASIEAMRTVHLSLGMVDIAQHITIDPQGLLWTGRPFDLAPASVRGHNGDAKQGPFMIEMIGLFEKENGKVVDTFAGDQKNAAYAAVCAVLRKFELEADAVRFHREFPATGKTCPGSDLDPQRFRADIAAELAGNALRGFGVSLPRGLRSTAVDRNAALGGVDDEEMPWAEVPESARALDDQARLAAWIERGLVEPASRAARGAEPRYQVLLPHLVNTSQGILSKEGRVWTTAEDLDNLVHVHLTEAVDKQECQHLLFYAHGGLNSEKGALEYARVMAPWWRSYGVYPIYFIWESSLFQSIFQAPRELERGARRGLGDFFDNISEALTKKLATTVWSRMKANARRCSAPSTEYGRPGGLREFWQVLEPWLDKNGKKVQLHAIGHSTGPILLSHFLPLVTASGKHRIRSLNYLAPAIRVDDFQRDVAPRLGAGQEIEQLRVFTMSDEAEQADDVAKVYRKSLLYYVSRACEGDKEVPILGLEHCLYEDGATRQLFGLAAHAGAVRAPVPANPLAPATVEFSQVEHAFPPNDLTQSRQHGYFDNDPYTMSTVLRGILGRTTLAGIPGARMFPTDEEFARGGALDDLASRALENEPVEQECCCCCCRRQQETGGADEGREEPDPELDGDPDADFGAGMKPEPRPPGGDAGSASPDRAGKAKPKRRALCVGIDKYPRQPLAGCVQDSENWARALTEEGFEVKKLQNGKATRAALDKALRELLQGAKPGDQLVFQYAGHGAQVEDLSGDDQDGFDEVMVPVDFDRGELWLDDDVYAACKTLPKGAFLTLITDCCHSGTNTRFAPLLGAPRGGASRDVRARYIALNAREIAAYKRTWKGSRAAVPVSEREPLPGVVHFAACQDKEVAYEEEGQGNFSRHALGVLGEVLGKKGSNRQFHQAIVRAFGSDGRQHPVFDQVAPGLAGAPLFGGR